MESSSCSDSYISESVSNLKYTTQKLKHKYAITYSSINIFKCNEIGFTTVLISWSNRKPK